MGRAKAGSDLKGKEVAKGGGLEVHPGTLVPVAMRLWNVPVLLCCSPLLDLRGSSTSITRSKAFVRARNCLGLHFSTPTVIPHFPDENLKAKAFHDSLKLSKEQILSITGHGISFS